MKDETSSVIFPWTTGERNDNLYLAWVGYKLAFCSLAHLNIPSQDTKHGGPSPFSLPPSPHFSRHTKLPSRLVGRQHQVAQYWITW
jgi:hypothetical protein